MIRIAICFMHDEIGSAAKNRRELSHCATAVSLDSEAADNQQLNQERALDDPILFATAHRRNRFFLFSRREPVELAEQSAEKGGAEEGEGEGEEGESRDRDVWNERPSAEELLGVPVGGAGGRAEASSALNIKLGTGAVLSTSMGDIQMKLYSNETPRTVENFSRHAREGYYNGHIFHRVIKGFIVQTGDPQGNGTGGESIWGGEFEDEFHPQLKHDRPYTVRSVLLTPCTLALSLAHTHLL